MVRVVASALLACALVAATAFAEKEADGAAGILGGVATAVADAMSRYSLDPGMIDQPAYAGFDEIASVG